MRTRRIISQAVVLAMALAVIPSARGARALTASDIQGRMETVQRELNLIGEKLEQAGHRLEVAMEAVITHRQALREADAKREDLRAAAGETAAQLYMLGTTADFAIGDDIADIADKMSYIDQVDHSSRATLEQIRALEAHAQRETGALNKALADAQSAREELASRRHEVSSRLADLTQLYQFLKSVDPRYSARASRGGGRGILCPVVGPHVLLNNWGAPRPGGPHTGDDIDANTGQPVRAVLTSRVVDVPWGGWMGIGIIIRDMAGNEWWYAHLSSANVRRGQVLSAGEIIGRVGCTGNCYGSHLHFEFHPGGGNPVNPYRVLSAAC